MKFLMRFADKLVGAFVLVALILLVGALLLIGSHRRWFREDVRYVSRFLSAEDLDLGMSMKLRGFEIGRVEALSLTPENQVEVTLRIHEEHAHRILPGSVLEITGDPLGLSSNLSFYPGAAGGEPLPSGAMLPSTDFPQGRELIASGRADKPEVPDEVSDILSAVPPLIREVDQVARTANALLENLDRTLMGGDEEKGGLLGQVDGTLQNADRAILDLERVLAELDDTARRLAVFSRHLEEPEGLLVTLLGAEGSVKTLLDDENRLYDELYGAVGQLDVTLGELRMLVAYLNQSRPQISSLLEGAVDTLEEGEKVMEGLKNNPLLRGGITQETEPAPPIEGYRQEVP